jgi:alcohol dehydrogenase class IV
MERAVVGIILVQFERRTSIVHAFGHGFSRRYDLQQGVIHAVTVPHVLRYLFEHVDAGREVLAEGLGIDASSKSDESIAEAVIEEVTAVRDALDLPSRLRDVDPVREEDLPVVSRAILEDDGMANAPPGPDPTAGELEDVLRDAW